MNRYTQDWTVESFENYASSIALSSSRFEQMLEAEQIEFNAFAYSNGKDFAQVDLVEKSAADIQQFDLRALAALAIVLESDLENRMNPSRTFSPLRRSCETHPTNILGAIIHKIPGIAAYLDREYCDRAETNTPYPFRSAIEKARVHSPITSGLTAAASSSSLMRDLAFHSFHLDPDRVCLN